MAFTRANVSEGILKRAAAMRTFLIEGSWGAQIVDELKPQDGEHIVIKKGYRRFSNTALDTILRHLGITIWLG